jgi:hypothetical protein
MAELTRRYVVMPLATPAPFDPWDANAAFVLKPWKDPAALRALKTYQDNCYPELAQDLSAWIGLIEDGTAVLGDVGRRNAQHLMGQADPATPAPAAGGPAATGRTRRRSRPRPKKRRR